MQLPNYFLADLPDQQTLSASLITEACRTLKRNRERFLAQRSTESVINVLASLARDWQDPEFPFRKLVLQDAPAHTGFTPETIAAGLDNLFARITKENLEALVLQDLGHLRRFEELVADERETRAERASMGQGPELLVHITGGVLPNPVITDIVLGLLARSAQFFKCASGAAYLPRMFAHSLYMIQPKLGACLEIAEWKGGNHLLENALFAEASCITATGTDETLDILRKRLPASVRFLGYGHKLSFTYITNEMLVKINLQKVLGAVADDLVAWNQLGCLSPHDIYIETGGTLAPQVFAEMLARELEGREQSEPRGQLPADEAAAISTRRMFYEVRASSADTTRVWASPDSTNWTVIYEEDPSFQVSCLNRFVYVKAVAGLDHLLHAVAPIQGKVSTVGLSAPINRAQEIATQLARWGASRICRVGQMQKPPLTWRHDGRPSLGDLITWADWEL